MAIDLPAVGADYLDIRKGRDTHGQIGLADGGGADNGEKAGAGGIINYQLSVFNCQNSGCGFGNSRGLSPLHYHFGA